MATRDVDSKISSAIDKILSDDFMILNKHTMCNKWINAMFHAVTFHENSGLWNVSAISLFMKYKHLHLLAYKCFKLYVHKHVA